MVNRQRTAVGDGRRPGVLRTRIILFDAVVSVYTAGRAGLRVTRHDESGSEGEREWREGILWGCSGATECAEDFIASICRSMCTKKIIKRRNHLA